MPNHSKHFDLSLQNDHNNNHIEIELNYHH